ncbi:TRAP transporter small permease subunit, partial [Marinobacter sp. 1Y8]
LLAAFAAFVERSQIIVDVFTQKIPQSIKGYLMGIFMMGFFIIGIVFSWGLYESAIDALEYGKVTQDLRISMMPIYMVSAFLSILLAIRSLIESINIFKTGEFFDAEETGA